MHNKKGSAELGRVVVDTQHNLCAQLHGCDGQQFYMLSSTISVHGFPRVAQTGVFLLTFGRVAA